VLTPVGATHGGAGLNLVRRALSRAGVRGNILVGTYPVTDPSLAAPIRLSFQGLKAKVAHRCGEWPQDLASGTSLEGWKNQTYWNFGCATQATLNAQLADARDLATPRGETAADIEMRMRGINRVRRGEDPATVWKLKPTTISTVGGQ
jgi:pilus assembly protein CpaD